MGDDSLGQHRAKARHMCQKRGRGRVQINANRVHGVFDHGIQRFGQAGLINVVLVLAHADGFGLDLDQFGKRIL